jgi:glycosyltransferase involved in cell wall biosynthesis
VRAFLDLCRFFRRHRFSFVQTHTPKASLLGLPAARLAGMPTLYTVHGSLFFHENTRLRNAAGWVFERWCCAWAARVLVQSREDADVLPRARICPRAKIVYIGNGIDLARFPSAPHPALSAPGRQPVILMVSRLVAEKGCRDFFRVARALQGNAQFVHVGPREADQHDAIPDEEMEDLSSAGFVRFTGPVDDVRPHLAAADLVLLPSHREGIPRVAMESAATGRPVVAYDVRGVREVIPPELGLLVPRGDVGALTRLVDDLTRSTERLPALGRACQEWVVANFSEDDVVERLRRLYATIEAA